MSYLFSQRRLNVYETTTASCNCLSGAVRPAGGDGSTGLRRGRVPGRARLPSGGGVHPALCGAGLFPGGERRAVWCGPLNHPGRLCGCGQPLFRLGHKKRDQNPHLLRRSRRRLVLRRRGGRRGLRRVVQPERHFPPQRRHHPGGAGGAAGAGAGVRDHRRPGPGPGHPLPGRADQPGVHRHGL